MAIGKEYLIGKKVVFKIRGLDVYFGLFEHYDNEGFWISSPDLMDQLQHDPIGAKALAKVAAEKPVCYVPMASVDYLITSEDSASR